MGWYLYTAKCHSPSLTHTFMHQFYLCSGALSNIHSDGCILLNQRSWESIPLTDKPLLPSFITVTSVFYQIYYLIRIIYFLKTTWECLLEAFLNNCEIISSNRNNPGTIKAQTAINWKMQEHQHRCPQSEGADQERSLCSKLTSSSLNEIYSLAHGQAKSFMVFKRDKD